MMVLIQRRESVGNFHEIASKSQSKLLVGQSLIVADAEGHRILDENFRAE